MRHTNLWLLATILATILVASFVISVPRTRDISPEPIAEEKAAVIPSVAIRDSFKKGLHTITGTVLAPNPCTSLSAQATLLGSASSTESILVAITMPESEGICLERTATIPFSTTLTAPARLPIVVTVNGEQATTTDL
ncbi:MAG: hypothetical protein WAV50_02965 [Minisyncoccia bacterium]